MCYCVPRFALFWTPNRTSSVSGNEYAQNVSSINGKSMLISGGAAGGYVKWCPTGAIFPQKCGRWYFQNAVGRENPAKARPLDGILSVQRARRTIESHQHHLSVPCSPPSALRSAPVQRRIRDTGMPTGQDRARHCMEACKTLQRSHYFKCLTH